MNHVAGAQICPFWSQKLYGLSKMIEALKDINQTTGSSVLWSVMHEQHMRDSDLTWVKSYCKSNLAGEPAEKLAIAICDSLLELPMEQREMVLYTSSYWITAQYGYCIYHKGCESCRIYKTHNKRVDEEEKEKYGIHDETGLSGCSGNETVGNDNSDLDSQ
ncbi:MAG: hypothetical protein NC548_06210 [Lachnospiraceae bacterium]|nr:hypothetical protein [Lachnospiraceae bacterium]